MRDPWSKVPELIRARLPLVAMAMWLAFLPPRLHHCARASGAHDACCTSATACCGTLPCRCPCPSSSGEADREPTRRSGDCCFDLDLSAVAPGLLLAPQTVGVDGAMLPAAPPCIPAPSGIAHEFPFDPACGISDAGPPLYLRLRVLLI